MTLEKLIKDYDANYTGTAIVDLLFGEGKTEEKVKEPVKKSWEIVRYSGNGKTVLDTILFKCPYCGAEFSNRSEHCGKCGKMVL